MPWCFSTISFISFFSFFFCWLLLHTGHTGAHTHRCTDALFLHGFVGTVLQKFGTSGSRGAWSWDFERLVNSSCKPLMVRASGVASHTMWRHESSVHYPFVSFKTHLSGIMGIEMFWRHAVSFLSRHHTDHRSCHGQGQYLTRILFLKHLKTMFNISVQTFVGKKISTSEKPSIRQGDLESYPLTIKLIARVSNCLVHAWTDLWHLSMLFFPGPTILWDVGNERNLQAGSPLLANWHCQGLVGSCHACFILYA